MKKFEVDGGTYDYMCKEYYTKTKIFGPEADIFSFGVFLYNMITGDVPFKTVKSLKSRREVVLPEAMNEPENCALRELLSNTLIKRPIAKRWTINQVLSSDYLINSPV